MKHAPVLILLILCWVVVVPFESAVAQTQQNDGPRKVSSKVVPVYPQIARTMNLAGTVRLEALVLANGKVKSVVTKGGNPLLVQAAQSAVHEWTWEKAEHDTTEQLEFNFRP